MKQNFISYFIISLACIGCQALFSQEIFRTTFYFTDAVGNRDSIVVGHDTSATNGMDPQFGEAELLTPFDSVFEVRAENPYAQIAGKLSKISISKPEKQFGSPYDCYLGGWIYLYIWAKYQPVTVEWKSEIFQQSPCLLGSLISNHYQDGLVFPYEWNKYPQNIYRCLALNDSLKINVSSEVVESNHVFNPVMIEKEVEGKGLQEIYGIRYYHLPYGLWSPCDELVGTEETVTKKDDVLLYPNPASSYVQIKNESGIRFEKMQLFNVQGKLLKVYEGKDISAIDLSEAEKGIYILMLLDGEGNSVLKKIVKL